ncbi:unnamed protein product [Lampetra planeri]
MNEHIAATREEDDIWTRPLTEWQPEEKTRLAPPRVSPPSSSSRWEVKRRALPCDARCAVTSRRTPRRPLRGDVTTHAARPLRGDVTTHAAASAARERHDAHRGVRCAVTSRRTPRRPLREERHDARRGVRCAVTSRRTPRRPLRGDVIAFEDG